MRSRRIAGTLAVIFSVCMLGSVVFIGCGSGQETQQENVEEQNDGKDANSGKNVTNENGVSTDAAQESEIGEADGETGYVFESNGVKIAVDMDMSAIADQLGEPDSYFEQPSCAAEGIAKIYTYSGFVIQTYPDGDRDLIACIILKDDSVATPEGIDLSMTKDDIIAAYGSDYEETDRSLVYEQGGGKLCFIMDGYNIASIEYDSPVLN